AADPIRHGPASPGPASCRRRPAPASAPPRTRRASSAGNFQRTNHLRITALKPQPRRPQRLDVFVDGELRLDVAVDVAQELGLRAGEEVDEAGLARASAADERWRAREAAISLLGYRARSAAELRRRLLRKQFALPVVEELVEDLAGRGYLDDQSFAQSFVRDRLGHHPRGRGRLIQELRARGVSADDAGEAVAEVFQQDDVAECDLARAAAEAWARKGGARTGGPEAKRRLYAFLNRRGFFGDAAREAVRAVLGKED
ncbi:MAG TPA: RecX family transcriptional regulator, partial [Longimicrobiales bacterium]